MTEDWKLSKKDIEYWFDNHEITLNVGLRPRSNIQLMFAALRMLNCKPKGKEEDTFDLLDNKGYLDTTANPTITQDKILDD